MSTHKSAKVPQHLKKYWSHNKEFYLSGVSNRWRIYTADGNLAPFEPFKNFNQASIKMNSLKVTL